MACRGCARNLTLLAHCTEISASGLVADLHKSVRAVGLQALAASLATAKKLQQEGCDAFVCGKAAIGLAVGVRIFHCKCVPGRHALCTNASTTDGNGSKASSDANRRGDGEVVAIHREAEKPYEVRFANGEKHCYSLR